MSAENKSLESNGPVTKQRPCRPDVPTFDFLKSSRFWPLTSFANGPFDFLIKNPTAKVGQLADDLVKTPKKRRRKPGTGRWCRIDAKQTTGQYEFIDIIEFIRSGPLSEGRKGTLESTDSVNDLELGSIDYTILSDGDAGLVLQLCFSPSESKRPISQSIALDSTQPHFGGLRWWFKCPMIQDGRSPCLRRVRKLYLVHETFGCRTCHDLTYQSCQATKH